MELSPIEQRRVLEALARSVIGHARRTDGARPRHRRCRSRHQHAARVRGGAERTGRPRSEAARRCAASDGNDPGDENRGRLGTAVWDPVHGDRQEPGRRRRPHVRAPAGGLRGRCARGRSARQGTGRTEDDARRAGAGARGVACRSRRPHRAPPAAGDPGGAGHRPHARHARAGLVSQGAQHWDDGPGRAFERADDRSSVRLHGSEMPTAT